MSETSKYEQALSQYNTQLDDAKIAAQVAQLIEEKVAENDTPEVKKFLMGSIELTTLKTTDSEESVMRLMSWLINMKLIFQMKINRKLLN